MSWTTDEIVPLVGMAADFVRVAMEATDADAAELREAVYLLKPLPGGLRSAIALQALKQEQCSLSQAENLARMVGGEFTAEMFSEVDKYHQWSYRPDAASYHPNLMGALSLGTVRNWLLKSGDSDRVKWMFASWFVQKAKELDEWDENSPDDQRIAAIVDSVEGSSSSSESDSDEMTWSTDDEYESE